MAERIAVRAGSRAMEIIRDEGLDLNRVKVLAGASGSAKFLVLTGIDRVLLQMLKGRTDPLFLIGTSIGAFRMAAFCQEDPLSAIARLEKEYIAQHYEKRPTREEINAETLRIIDAYIGPDQIKPILNHPFMRISFLSNRCCGLLKSERLPVQWAGLMMAAGVNLISRRGLGAFFERALFHAPGPMPPFAGMDGFPIASYELTEASFKAALLSSGSIPVMMAGVSNISGAPGVFRDGGILDYHLDIPFLPDEDRLVLFPHFYETITPGWFDKRLNRKPDPGNMKNVVVVAPSKDFVSRLPFGRIPDRKDFLKFKKNDSGRMAFWRTVVEKNHEMGEDFFEAVTSGKIRKMVQPL